MSYSLFQGIVENYFKRNGGWLRLKGELAVYYWPRIAGSEIAAKVEAIHFRDGYLYLKTENPSLAHQVTLLNQDIIKKFQKLLGKGIIKGVRVKIGSIEGRPKASEQETLEMKLTSENEEIIAKCSQDIQDPQLAVCFSMFMKKAYLLRAKIDINSGKKCGRCGINVEKDFDYCPCCERQIKEENLAYRQYLKKTSSDGLNLKGS